VKADAAECAALGVTSKAASTEYRTNNRACYPVFLSQAAPTTCASGCTANAGTGTISTYRGDGNQNSICLLRNWAATASPTQVPTPAPTYIANSDQGLCRASAKHGGYCNCGVKATAAECEAVGSESSAASYERFRKYSSVKIITNDIHRHQGNFDHSKLT
jgi:hypothetical protein